MTARPPAPGPPRAALWLLRALTPAAREDAILGDFQEGFAEVARYDGLRRARRWYWGEVLRSTLALFVTFIHGEGYMLKNYLRLALRNAARHKGYAAINVTGLAVGIACCVLIYLYVRDELAYDRFHEHIDRIYRVTSGYKDATFGATPGPLADALVAEYPAITHAARLGDAQVVVRQGTALFQETVHYADPALLQMFTFPLDRGTPDALRRPEGLVLSAEAAEKYFGRTDPYGRTLELRLGDSFQSFVVTGVAAPIPANSSIRFDILVPIEAYRAVYGDEALTDWGSYGLTTLVLFDRAEQAAGFEAGMPAFIEKYLGTALRADDEDPADYGFFFEPMATYHLAATTDGNALQPPGHTTYSYILSGIALLVLLIACFNFVNLTVGRSAARAKEIGVRRVLGAQRGQLRRQFWIDALLLVGVALLVGLVLAGAALPAFNDLTGKHLVLADFARPVSLLVFAGLLLLVGLAAGSYPAAVLSRFEAVDAFRGRLRLGGNNGFTRTLVVVQFVLSIGLIICAAVMVQQQQFLKTKNLGFDREHLVVVPMQAAGPGASQGSATYEPWKQALAGRDGIVGVTGSSPVLGRGTRIHMVTQDDGTRTAVFFYRVDYGYLETMDIELVAGRFFSPDYPSDAEQAIVVNEAFVRSFGLESPVGASFPYALGAFEHPTIIGVVKDYHFQRLHTRIQPLYLHVRPDDAIGYATVRLAPGATPSALDGLADTWRRLRPDTPFDYFFLDEALNAQYRAEERWSAILRYAAGFAILIACLGLLGLTALTVAQRTREVGIRKVLGASVPGLVGLLSKDFLLLVLAANVLAWPVAYLVMHRWLDAFSYRIEMSGWIFLGAGLVALGVAFLTVSYQAVRAARVDPVQTLRHE